MGNSKKISAKMKIVFCLLLVSYSLQAALGSPVQTQLCLARAEGNNNCGACHNQKKNLSEPRFFKKEDGTCTKDLVNYVDKCKYWSGVATETKTLNDCRECDNRAWMILHDKEGVVESVECIDKTSTYTNQNYGMQSKVR